MFFVPTKMSLSGFKIYSFSKAQVIIKCFYAFLLFICLESLPAWYGYLQKTTIDPLWPIAWVRLISNTHGIQIILVGFLITSLLGILSSRSRSIRFLVFSGVLEFTALLNSFGEIDHGCHLLILIAFLLILLPRDWQTAYSVANRYCKIATMMVFSLCQGMIMLTYTMSSFGKFIFGILQMSKGQLNWFSPESLAVQIANRLLQTSSESILGGFVIHHAYLVWPLTLGMLHVQFLALWVA